MKSYFREPAYEAAELRLDESGALDEIVSQGAHVHLERLAGGGFFLSVGPLSVWISGAGRLRCHWEGEGMGGVAIVGSDPEPPKRRTK